VDAQRDAAVNEHEFLLDVLKGNHEAAAFCESLGAISQAWDDLIDTGDAAGMNGAMTAALVSLPANPFYREHFTHLQPLVQASIIDWLTANELERGSPHDKTLAFVLRDSLTAVVIQCAAIVGGLPWAIANAPRIRRAMQQEPLSHYLKGLEP